MAAQLFTVLNDGSTSVNITSIDFNTPVGIQHEADLSNFTGGVSNFTGASYSGTTPLAVGQSITFTVDHFYVSGPIDTRIGTIDVNTDIPSTETINTTIVVGNSGSTTSGNLPGQGTYTATRTNTINGESYIVMSFLTNGVLDIDSYNGTGFYGGWVDPYPAANIGSSFWVKFTRQSQTGSGTYYSSPTTGWLPINQQRSIIVSATGLPNGTPSTQSATYLVEVANDSLGTSIFATGTYVLIPTGTLGGIVNPLDNIVVNASGSTPGTARVSFLRNGSRNQSSNGAVSSVTPWYLNGGSTIGDTYYIRATIKTGTQPTSGTMNDWVLLDQTRTWELVNSAPDSNAYSQFQIDISTAPSSNNIVASCNVDFYISTIGSSFSDGGGGGGLTTDTMGFDDGSTISVTTDDNGQTVSVTSTPATDGGGAGGSKVICTELYYLGYLDEDIYKIDQEFGKHLLDTNPRAYWGYRIWADVLVNYMQGKGNPIIPKLLFWLTKEQKQKLSQQIAVNIARALGKPFAYELARRHGKYDKFHLGGYLLVEVGLKICSLIFKIKRDKK